MAISPNSSMTHSRNHSTRLASLAGVILVLLAVWILETAHPTLSALRDRLEYLAYDLRLNLSLSHTQSERIVIVDIDEASLQAEGRWPWSRQRIGELVEQLAKAGAAVIAFDMVFAEPERNPLLDVLERLPEHADLRSALHNQLATFDADAHFARSLAEADTVLGFILHNQNTPPSGMLSAPLTRLTADQPVIIPRMRSYSGNLAELQSAARSSGFLTTLPDSDGVIRRSPLVLQYNGAIYPSLALAAVSTYLLIDNPALHFTSVGAIQAVDHLQLGATRIPVDASGRVLIPYRGAMHNFAYVSATDVLHARVDPARLENRIALIGASALALADLKATPVAGVYPGVEIQATLMDAMLDGRFPAEPAWARGANFTLLLLIGIALALLLPHLNAVALLVTSTAVLALLVGGNVWLWQQHGLALSLALPVLLVMMLAMLNLAYGFVFEARGRRQLKNMFGQYVPPELVEEMSQRPEHFGFEGESRELSVLFADIRNFTSISESLPAADLKTLLNRFFTPMTRIIFERRGTIDKYVGDMIMAFWGAPVRDTAHANHAVAAALDMLQAVERLKPEFAALGYPEVNIGIGINTGSMNVGDMGSEYRRAYTVLGDAVNLASRLEGLTKYYGVALVVGPATCAQATEFIYRRLDRVRVKGKQEAVEVFAPVCRAAETSESLRQELQQHEQALAHFWSQQWDAAQRGFSALQAAHPDVAVYTLYLERIAQLRARGLPADWDGVYERREK